MEYIFGRRPVLEALQAGKRSIHKIWIVAGSHGVEDMVAMARDRGVPTEFTRRDRLDRMVQGHHQGVVAQASAASYVELDDFLRSLGPLNPSSPAVSGGGSSQDPAWVPGQRPPGMTTLVVALDEIQDPHNIGAILRSAGFFGVAAAIVPRWRSAPVGETAARVSSGAIEHVPLIRVRNLAESINDLKDAGFEVVGADLEGGSLREHRPHPRTAIVFGSEGKGMRRLVRERCDKLLKVHASRQAGPASGVASLNVSAAAAIFLYEFCRNKVGSQPT